MRLKCRSVRSPAPVGTGDYRHRHRHQPATAPTGTDRPGLFYDIFDTHFVLNSQKRHDILKILIKNVIKQPRPVGAGLVLFYDGFICYKREIEIKYSKIKINDISFRLIKCLFFILELI
jgi:hypothetical protein